MIVSLILNELLYSDSSGITRGENEMKFMNTTCSDDMAGIVTTCVCMCLCVLCVCVCACVCMCRQ